MRARLQVFLVAFAGACVFFMIQGGTTNSINPLPNFISRSISGDQDGEMTQQADFECVEKAFKSFPKGTVFRSEIKDPFFIQRTIEIGFPHVYFSRENAAFSVDINSEPSNENESQSFFCPTFKMVITVAS